MIRRDGIKGSGLALTLVAALLLPAGSAHGASLDQEGCYQEPKVTFPPPPKLSAPPQVKPESSPGPWTATFSFKSAGQVSVVWGCLEKGAGVAENVGYSSSVVGRYGKGKAEEVVTLSIGKPTGVPQPQPWMGTHTFTTYMDCPDGNPWLFAKPCKVTGTATPIPGISFTVPFPLTRGQVPPEQREQLLYKAFPLQFVQPAQNQQIPNGKPVTVQLAKSGPVAAQPVTLTFSSGTWTEAKTFKRTMLGSTLTVDGTAFSPGEWKVSAAYSKEHVVDGISRTFVVTSGWGGGSSGGGGGGAAPPQQPDSAGQSAPVQPAGPILPAQPAKPAAPSRSVRPSDPVQPVAPVLPAQPGDREGSIRGR